jgi:hypothetical protein
MSTYDGFERGIFGGDPVKLAPATIPERLRTFVAFFVADSAGGNYDAAITELLERGLHQHFMERMHGELSVMALAAKAQRGES